MQIHSEINNKIDTSLLQEMYNDQLCKDFLYLRKITRNRNIELIS